MHKFYFIDCTFLLKLLRLMPEPLKHMYKTLQDQDVHCCIFLVEENKINSEEYMVHNKSIQIASELSLINSKQFTFNQL